jgi:hypothetical protein
MSLSRCTTPHSDDLCYNDEHEHLQSKEDEHIRTQLQYTRKMQTIFSMIIETKTYNTEVVWNSVVKLLAKGNFKRRLVCDEFDKIRSNWFQTKLKLTPNET